MAADGPQQARLRRVEQAAALRVQLTKQRQEIDATRVEAAASESNVHEVQRDATPVLSELRSQLEGERARQDAAERTAARSLAAAKAERAALELACAAANAALASDLGSIEMLIRQRHADEDVHTQARDSVVAHAALQRIEESIAASRRRVDAAETELAALANTGR